MAGTREDPGLFRQKSLERLSSPERLDQLLEVVDRKSWIPLATSGALILVLVAWSVAARIPIHVEGRGILVRPRKVVAIQSPGAGRVVHVLVEIGERVRAGQTLATIERPDLAERLRLQKQKAAEMSAESRRNATGQPGPGRNAADAASLRDHIERSRAHAAALRDQRLAALEEERQRLDSQEAAARELTDSLRERLAAQRRLRDEGLVAPSEVDAAELLLVDSLERLYEVQTLRGALRTALLEAHEHYYDRMQTIAEWTFQLGQDIGDVEREVTRLEAQLVEETRIVSEQDGRILELSATAGAFLTPGERVGALEVSDPRSTLQSVSYFRVRDGKRLASAMAVHVSPDNVERERFGSIRGVVRSVSDFPVSLEHATSVVGNRIVAQSLIDAGYLIEVTADLDHVAGDPERYAWTTSRGPDLAITAGTTTRARVAVEHVRPIALVIPLLRSAAGVD
jgi:HlyD family secretion protein